MSELISYQCDLSEGIHARPAGHIERLCNSFQSNVCWENSRTGLEGNAKSALSLVGTDTLFNDICAITISGEDALAAANQLSALLKKLPEFEVSPTEESAAPAGYLPRSLRETQLNFIQGSRISGGVAIAKPVVVRSLSFAEMLTRSPTQKYPLQQEKNAVIEGIEILKNEKISALESTSGVEHDIVQAHLSIMTDISFQNAIINYIDRGKNGWQAIILSAMDFCDVLNRSASKYIKERTLDVFDITSQLLATLYGDDVLPKNNLDLQQPSIILADNLTPSKFLSIDKRWLAGLVLSSTGKTSHTAILARSLGIPTLTDIDFHALRLDAQQEIIIDGNPGILITAPDARVLRYYHHEMSVQQKMQQQMLATVNQTATSADGHRVEIAANIASLAEANAAFDNGAEGIGLFRTEMSFMDRETPPDYAELAELYTQVAIRAENKPVIFRTFDIGGDKPVDYLSIGDEENPFLGFRAVRTYRRYQDLFAMQLQAILTASAHGNAKIMIPMISNVEEVIWCREVLAGVMQEMNHAGLAYNAGIELGVMLEVPSVIFAIPEIAEYADFFSVGSNDLTQYFFAADRGNRQVAEVYDNYAPSFIRAMQFAAQEVHRAGKWIGICGELGASPDFLPLFTGMGFDELSMSNTAIPGVKHALRELNFTKCQQLAQQTVQLKRSAAVKAALQTPDVKAVSTRPLLAPEFILCGLEASDKNEVIKKMTDNLWLHHRTDNREQLCDDIWAREDSFSTAVGYGFAIPHTKSDHIGYSTISMATLAKPILWGDQEVATVFMLTVNKSADPQQHMKYFSILARTLMKEEFRDAIKNADNVTLLYNLMTRTLDV
ncbi:phosphoenolpyruvate--protein phosphotransferase [Pantoea phytobeneficialis]|uniref:Phosphoenolpyruvate--protein phosphotransferase n=1 Tax=Pantoea phytobeneficialis TaxID=2052056 RepID=A0AAP9HB53_9GAMM|nr:phosphoenolpyruvate--protein phosphotransferase [Pantoea phytobeneficialis]MDO6407053.1 phosphoenolpyruvate--protein phosphotransferase [Pantoea phytobeneficialis]QGR10013.1 phosphoenolpyruvate--protein phosphotransferase [Pantoea phytobeneficialis]